MGQAESVRDAGLVLKSISKLKFLPIKRELLIAKVKSFTS